jgi:hypothetical protein
MSILLSHSFIVLNKINENIYYNIQVLKKVKEMNGEWQTQVTEKQPLASMFEHNKDAKENATELAPGE